MSSAVIIRQRGVVMIITLIALIVLLISGAALIRSFDTSMLLAGNLAFKRDLVNQGERGLGKAVGLFRTGALSLEATRDANQSASNYYASAQASSDRGVPDVLRDKIAPDMTDTTAGVKIYYVIDRQCSAAGSFDPATCVSAATTADKGGTSWIKRAGGERRPVYRISVKVQGPRGTEAYLQSTIVQ